MKKICLIVSLFKRLLSMQIAYIVQGCKLLRYFSEYKKFKKLGGFAKDFQEGALYPCLGDLSDNAGVAVGDYFNQDLYVAQRIYKNNPDRLFDINSIIFIFHIYLQSFSKLY